MLEPQRCRRSRPTTAGVIVDVITDRLTTVCADNRVEGNLFDASNRASSALPSDDTADLQPGIGVIIAGADRTTVAHNTIRGHTLAGMTLVDFCLDRADVCAMPGLPIDPLPDGNRIVSNTFDRNASDVLFFPNGGQGQLLRAQSPARGGRDDAAFLPPSTRDGPPRAPDSRVPRHPGRRRQRPG